MPKLVADDVAFHSLARWEHVPLSSLCDIDYEVLAASTPKDYSFYYIDISSVSEGRIQLPRLPIRFGEAPSRARIVVHRGDVLMATVRPNLKAFAYFDSPVSPCIASTGFAVLSANDGADGRFLLYALLSDDVSRQIESLVVGSNYPAINTSQVRRLNIYRPLKPYQRKIAKILTTLDNLIEKTESLIAKYQAIKQGLMHDLFTRGVDEHGQLRPPQSEAPHLYKNEPPLGWIPQNWCKERVGDHLDRIEQGWSPDCDSEPASAGEWGVLKTTAVVWDGFTSQENKRLPTGLRPLPHYEIRQHDVLMTRGGPNSRVGVVAIVRQTRDKIMLSDKIYRLVPKPSILPAFLAYVLSSEGPQIHLSTLKTGLAESQTNISQAIVRQLWIALPDPDEQQRICVRLDSIERSLSAERIALAKHRVQKSGLMQDLLTGKVPVTPDQAEEVTP